MIRFVCFSGLVSPALPPGDGGDCGYGLADEDVLCDGCDWQPLEVMLQRCLVDAHEAVRREVDCAA